MFLAGHAASVALKEGARGDRGGDEVTAITSWGNHLEGIRKSQKHRLTISEGAREKTVGRGGFGFATEIGVGRDVAPNAFWTPLIRALPASDQEFGRHSAALQFEDQAAHTREKLLLIAQVCSFGGLLCPLLL